MTAPENAAVAYGQVLGEMAAGLQRLAADLQAGFRQGLDNVARAAREYREAEARRLVREARRQRIASFDVETEQARLDDLGRRNRVLAERWGVEL